MNASSFAPSALETTKDAANPMGTDGFEFIEYTAPDPKQLDALFRTLGFRPIARHRSKDVTLYRQGGINFVLNAEPESFAQAFARVHGPSICAIALRVRDARQALERALSLGAELHPGQAGPMELNIPAIRGIGGSLIYLVDRYRDVTIYDIDFNWLPDEERQPRGVGLTGIDHLTHNVHRGRMNAWAGFYERIFNFRELKYFDIEGKLTGLHSRAMVSPCGKIRIPINESADDKSQIEEFLHAYHGEGIQHVALATDDIYAAVEELRRAGVRFLDTPDTYYEQVDQRLPGHGEDLERLRRNRILIDGTPARGAGAPRNGEAAAAASTAPPDKADVQSPATGSHLPAPRAGTAAPTAGATNPEGGRLLQIFTETVIGPIFFEIIQRKGDEGFGEGNFKALFDSIEEDQIRRGVLKNPA